MIPLDTIYGRFHQNARSQPDKPGKTGLNLTPIETLDQALRPTVRTMRFRDGDMLCMCDMARAVAPAA